MTTTDRRVTTKAHAKINLTLHVTGQRDDGYHLLDSLVMFTAFGDDIAVEGSDRLTLTIDGPHGAGLPTGDSNLVIRAAQLMADGRGAKITLTKNLPVASGIGGGSADAAATMFALSQLWNVPLPAFEDILALGADVPVCLSTELTRMNGIGEDLHLIGPAPDLPMLLVNPNVGVSTPQVFAGLDSKTNPAMTDPMPNAYNLNLWLDWLRQQRNDLEAAAIKVAPDVRYVLQALQDQSGARIARMSGSGATCFAIFETAEARDTAATRIAKDHPDWWIIATTSAD